MVLFTYFITYNIMGKDYDVALFASSNFGFGMSATINAFANTDALTNKFCFAKTPYITVPIVGCLLILLLLHYL